MDEQDKTKLRELIEELGKYRGRHTELVTVYAPQGSSINQVANQIASEQSTAMNIKSKATRTNVIDALERIIRHLKLYKGLPPNGMAIFCGNVSEREGQPDIKIWAIETPQPLRVKFYRCDQVFVLEPLKDMLQSIDVYGLVVLDRREATIGVLDGKSVTKLKHLTSGVPGKFKSGGQSAARFDRLTEEMAKEFHRRIASSMKEAFAEMPKLKGILIGGPGPTKEEFLREGQLAVDLKRKILAVKDVGYTDEQGLGYLVEASQEDIAAEAIIKEKEILKKFFETLGRNPTKAAYQLEDVRKALEHGAVQELVLYNKLDKQITKELEEKAKSTSADVFYVSDETNEGLQFKNLSGVGAILRFAIN
jgi:peptide chain release factor subunit 1